MRLHSRAVLTASFVSCFALAAMRVQERNDAAAESMSKAAREFLDGLDEAQRAKASLPFDSPARTDWHFVPRERKGLAIGELSETNRKSLDALLDSGFSKEGHEKFDGVVRLEQRLRDTEGPWRDPGKYHVAIFGQPGVDPWGWRIEGHHFSAHFTSVNPAVIAVTPSFVGASPSTVMLCDNEAMYFLTVLGSEEERAQKFLESLSPEQRARARLPGKSPADVLLDPARSRLDGRPQGLCAGELQLGSGKRGLLRTIVEGYFADLSPELETRERARFAARPLEELHFAWAGDKPGEKPWYWRVQGSYFAIEFVYPRGEIDHIHRVWRDFERDLGGDPLREHLAKER